MPFAQTNYQQKLGNSNLTIDEAGCFVTADCNLLEDIGVEIDPPSLNNFYRDNGFYTYDLTDRANDDITWSTVTKYNDKVTVKNISSGGWPDSNFAIVKFYYKSHSGYMITHFSKVHDWTQKQIVDSWDGKVKTVGAGTYYGEPVQWATYTYTPPPPPPPAPAPTPETKASYEYKRFNTPLEVQTKIDANVWDLNYGGSYSNAKSNGVATRGTKFTAVGKATKLDFADHPVYYMSNESFGDADKTGIPAYNQGINTADLEPAAVAPAAVVDGDKIEVKVVPPNPDAWKTTFKVNDAGDYIAQASTIVHDLETDMTKNAGDSQLIKGQTVHVAGTFTGPDGIDYYRTVHSTNGFTDSLGVAHTPNWRGIPLESLKEDDALYTFKDDLIDDFKEIIGQVSTRQKVIKTAATIHGEISWLHDRLKKGKK